jgi:hypothetical protein
VGVLNDGRDESVGVVFEFGLHGRRPSRAGVEFGRWFRGRKERKGCVGVLGLRFGWMVFGCGMKKGGGAGEGWAVCWGYE